MFLIEKAGIIILRCRRCSSPVFNAQLVLQVMTMIPLTFDCYQAVSYGEDVTTIVGHVSFREEEENMGGPT